MYDNPFVTSLDNLLAWLGIPNGTRRLPLRIIGVIFFKVILLGATTPLRNGTHIPFPFTKSVASSGVMRPSWMCSTTWNMATSFSWQEQL
jgi:hypothetical protein